MKKLLPLLMAAILILCPACSESKPSDNRNSNVSSSDSSKEEVVVGARQNVGDCTIELKSYRMTQTRVWTTDYDILVVSYEWTNNSGGPRSFEGEFQHYAFQNGIACNEHIFAVDEAETSADNDPWRKIQSGHTQIIRKAYELLDTTTDVSIEIGTSGGYLAHTIIIDSDQPSQGSDSSGGSGSEDVIPSGKALYKNILDTYIGYTQGDDRANYKHCRYVLYDIDKNGVEELLVRYKDYGDEYTKLYTYADGKVNEIGEFWSRNLLMLDENGDCYVFGSNGYDNTILEIQRISHDGTALVTMEAWEGNGPVFTYTSKDGEIVISNSAYQAAVDRFLNMTTDFVDSLNWQYLVGDASGELLDIGKPAIVGSWIQPDTVLGPEYAFYADGSGLRYPELLQEDLLWSAEGSSLFIHDLKTDITSEYEYEIVDDELFIRYEITGEDDSVELVETRYIRDE